MITTIFISILGIILTILIVVGVHEFGHFIVARLVGVKVLRFSIGFGKPLFKWHGKKGTEYVFAALPLGGYVQMLDEFEGVVPKKDLALAYNRQPVWKRFLIVAAGPFFNLLFAFLIYWLLFVIGFNTISPIVGNVIPGSIASKAGIKKGDEILSINSQYTQDWNKIIFKLISDTGGADSLNFSIKDTNQNIKNVQLDLLNWHLDELRPDPLKSLGIEPYAPNIPAIIDKTLPESDAFNKLHTGDVVLAINNTPVNDWSTLVKNIMKYPNQTVHFKIKRSDKIMEIPLKIGAKKNATFVSQGFLGITPKFEFKKELIRHIQYSPFQAIFHAYDETMNFISLNFIILGKMFTGKISFKSLGGPIAIFQSAGTALNYGIIPFLGFLAFLSISIGIINVLPIPGLDGGHVLFQAIEVVTRKPVPLPLQLLLFRLGIILLLLLVVQAVMNDILRLT